MSFANDCFLMTGPAPSVDVPEGCRPPTAAARGPARFVRPVIAQLELSSHTLVFSDSDAEDVTTIQRLIVRNAGVAAVTVPQAGLTVSGPHAHHFTILPGSALPTTLEPGAGMEVAILFNPGVGSSTGIKTASLRIISTAPATVEASVLLQGITTAAPAEVSLLRRMAG